MADLSNRAKPEAVETWKRDRATQYVGSVIMQEVLQIMEYYNMSTAEIAYILNKYAGSLVWDIVRDEAGKDNE